MENGNWSGDSAINLPYDFISVDIKDLAVFNKPMEDTSQEGYSRSGLACVGNRVLMLTISDLVVQSSGLRSLSPEAVSTAVTSMTRADGPLRGMAAHWGFPDRHIYGPDYKDMKEAGRSKNALKAVEAVIGAVWYDSGHRYPVCLTFVEECLEAMGANLCSYGDRSPCHIEGNKKGHLHGGAEAFTPLETLVGHHFQDRRFLAKALTCSSAVGEGLQPVEIGDYQTLEYIGDRVLNLVISDSLVRDAATRDLSHITTSSMLSHAFMSLGSNRGPMARIAGIWGLAEHILMGKGDEANGNRDRSKLHADVMESVVGAIWLDSGGEYRHIRSLVLRGYRRIGHQVVISVPAERVHRVDTTHQSGQAAWRHVNTTKRCEDALRYTFQDKDLLARSLTMVSALNEGIQLSGIGHMDQLVFLGAHLLTTLLATRMVDQSALGVHAPDVKTLTRGLARVLGKDGALARSTRTLKLSGELIMGPGSEKAGMRDRPETHVKVFKALIAAVWLDSGKDYKAVHMIVSRVLGAVDFGLEDCSEIRHDL